MQSPKVAGTVILPVSPIAKLLLASSPFCTAMLTVNASATASTFTSLAIGPVGSDPRAPSLAVAETARSRPARVLATLRSPAAGGARVLVKVDRKNRWQGKSGSGRVGS